jgi:HEAT repeat protein
MRWLPRFLIGPAARPTELSRPTPMTERPHPHLKPGLVGTVVLLLASGCATSTVPPPSAGNPPPYAGLVSLDYSGSQAARDSLQQAIAAAGQDQERLASIEARLIEMLGRPDMTFAGQQVVCENLGRLFASDSAHREPSVPPVLVHMLADETKVDLARMALERAPGAAVDDAFVSSLGKSSGRVRIALIQSVGNRRIAAGVPALENILLDPDGAAVAAAANALGQIGSQAALGALAKAHGQASAAVAEARIRCARRLPPSEALAVLQDVRANEAVPTPIRVSAFLAVLSLEPDTVSGQVAAVLGGDDAPLKQAVLASLVSFPANAVIPVVTANLKSWDPSTQSAAIMALGRIGDPSALPVVMAAARSDDNGLRRAAISTLGELPGDPDVASLLADASGEMGETGKAARQSLSRLKGPGVAEAVLSGATRIGDPRRLVFLEQLALRNAPGASEILMKARDEQSVAVRCAALDGLALVAPAGEESALISWMNSATDATEQSHATRAVVGAAERNPDPQARLKPVADLIEDAPLAAQRRLLAILSRTGGSFGADYVARFALKKEGALAQSAVTALGQWSDKSALGALATVAEKTSSDSLRKAAVYDAIQAMEGSSGRLTKEQKAIVERLRVVTKDAELARRLSAMEARVAK